MWPLFIVVMLAIIEFGVAFGSLMRVNFASRNASLLGAEAGSRTGSDCVILNSIEGSIGAPASSSHITQVTIFRSDQNGDVLASNLWDRTGSTACAFGGQSFTVPYTQMTDGYPEASRCDVLVGCGGQPLDTIGVSVTYDYRYVTPLGAALTLLGGPAGSSGWTFVQTNQMRMEPVL